MKTTRHSPAELTRLAVCAATGEQKEKLTKMLETGWEVTGTLTSGYRTAISLYWKDSGLWLLPDGRQRSNEPDQGAEKSVTGCRTARTLDGGV